jgi:hypothetical protein
MQRSVLFSNAAAAHSPGIRWGDIRPLPHKHQSRQMMLNKSPDHTPVMLQLLTKQLLLLMLLNTL